MDAATEHVRALARRVVAVATELGPLRAALLAGSGARGDADFFSDLDLLLYVDEDPPEGRLDALQEAVGGTNVVRIAPGLVQFDVGGIAVQVSYRTVAQIDEELEAALERLEEVVGSPNQKMLSGLLEGLPLHGEELLGRWRERAAAYPDALRLASIEHHWRFFPLWWYGEAMAVRDTELWRLDMLLEAAFNLLAVLAALNRLPPPEAAAELGRLVVETRELVAHELPELELPLLRLPGTSAQPWRP